MNTKFSKSMIMSMIYFTVLQIRTHWSILLNLNPQLDKWIVDSDPQIFLLSITRTWTSAAFILHLCVLFFKKSHWVSLCIFLSRGTRRCKVFYIPSLENRFSDTAIAKCILWWLFLRFFDFFVDFQCVQYTSSLRIILLVPFFLMIQKLLFLSSTVPSEFNHIFIRYYSCPTYILFDEKCVV